MICSQGLILGHFSFFPVDGEVHMNEQQKRKHDELPISERRKNPCVTAQAAKVVPGRVLQAIKREEEARKR